MTEARHDRDAKDDPCGTPQYFNTVIKTGEGGIYVEIAIMSFEFGR